MGEGEKSGKSEKEREGMRKYWLEKYKGRGRGDRWGNWGEKCCLRWYVDERGMGVDGVMECVWVKSRFKERVMEKGMMLCWLREGVGEDGDLVEK